MFKSRKKPFSTGFTLVEILVVMVIMGLVITSVYSLFVNSQRTANTSEEVVDVQQNLRVALSAIVSDIRMAGFLVTNDQRAIEQAPARIGYGVDVDNLVGQPLVLRTSSSAKSYARIVAIVGTPPLSPFIVEVDRGMAANFRDGNRFDILNPQNSTSIVGPDNNGKWREIGSVNPTNDQITFSEFHPDVRENHILVRKYDGEEDSMEITYWLENDASRGDNNLFLMRDDGSGPVVVASNIVFDPDATNVDQGIRLEYFDINGNVTTNIERIRSVQVIIAGQTDNTRTGLANYSGVKNRSLQTVVKLRNAYEE